MALCNDAAKSGDSWLGDPTETALSDYIGNDEYLRIREENPRIDEIPFDSDRKLMTTVHNIGGERTAYTKGAVDVLLPRMKFVLTESGTRPFTDEDAEAHKGGKSAILGKRNACACICQENSRGGRSDHT